MLPLEFQCLKVVLHVIRKKMTNLLLEEIPLLRRRIPSCVQQDLGFIASMIKDRKLCGWGW